MRLWEKQTFQAKTLNSRLSLVSLFFFSLADKLKFHFFMNMILILAIPAISTANPKTKQPTQCPATLPHELYSLM